MYSRVTQLRAIAKYVHWRDIFRFETLLIDAIERESRLRESRKSNKAVQGNLQEQTLASVRLRTIDAEIQLRTNSADALVVHEIFGANEYSFLLSLFRSPPKTALDLGANIGLMSLWLQAQYPQLSSYIVEADFVNYGLAACNLRKSIVQGRTRGVCAAAWDSDGIVALDRASRGEWSYRCVETTSRGMDCITAASMMTLINSSGFQHIDLLKIDIEGGERNLLENKLSEWIHRIGYIVCERHDLSHNWFEQCVQPHGFSCFVPADRPHLSIAVAPTAHDQH